LVETGIERVLSDCCDKSERFIGPGSAAAARAATVRRSERCGLSRSPMGKRGAVNSACTAAVAGSLISGLGSEMEETGSV
jgi:hypothetical protein